MLFLAVDTAGTTGGVLLAKGEDADNSFHLPELLGFRSLPSREFSTLLVAAIAELLDGHPYRFADVDVFAAVSGPGSFTGLRVGLSAVKALVEAASKPVVAVSRLAVMASAATADGLEGAETVHAVLGAGRSEFYHGVYRDCGWTRVEESLQTLESLTASLNCRPGLLVASEPAVLAALQPFEPREIPDVGARQALPLVWRSWREGRVTDVLKLDANYLRASDAEILARLAVHAQQRNSTVLRPIDEPIE